MKSKQKTDKIQSEDLDKKFDEGTEDILEYFDTDKIKAHKRVKRINIDIPFDMVKEIDQEAQRIGVARTALIKMWIAQQLKP